MKTKYLLLIGICIILTFGISCKKENAESSLRLTRITRTTYAGSAVAAEYRYNEADQLVKVQYPGYAEDFTYQQDGKLSTYTCGLTYASNYTFHYSGKNPDYALITYTGKAPATGYDTVFFYYDTEGNVSGTYYKSVYNIYHYEFMHDAGKRVTRRIIVESKDSTWYSWDDSGDLVSTRHKYRNEETGGYDDHTTQYQYLTASNVLRAIPYPESWLLIRWCDPSPDFSSHFSTGGCSFYYTWPLEKEHEFSIDATNDSNYPLHLTYISPEVQYSFEYEEY